MYLYFSKSKLLELALTAEKDIVSLILGNLKHSKNSVIATESSEGGPEYLDSDNMGVLNGEADLIKLEKEVVLSIVKSSKSQPDCYMNLIEAINQKAKE